MNILCQESKIKLKHWLLGIAFFLLTIQNSQVAINYGYQKILEYLGLAIILISILIKIMSMNLESLKNNFKVFFIVLFLMSIGILFQNLVISKKVYLIISLAILCAIAIFPSALFEAVENFKYIAYAILSGTLFTCALAIVTEVPLFTGSTEGFLDYGFNAGTEHRNYFAYTILAAFIALDLTASRSFIDKLLMIISIVLILISVSRSALVVLVLYLVIKNYKFFKIDSNSNGIKFSTLIVLMIICGIFFLVFIAPLSETYSFRLNGVKNYFEYYKNDLFHLFFGIAEVAFCDNEYDYIYNVQNVIGWDGSVEIVFLNIMIKSGILGLIGYVILFCYLANKQKYISNQRIKLMIKVIFVTFIISAFVESFLANINYLYGVFCYCCLSNLPTPILYKNYGCLSKKLLLRNKI